MERRGNSKARTPSTAVPGLVVNASIPVAAVAAAVETETVALNRLGVDQPMDNAAANGATGGDHPSLATSSASSASSNGRPSSISAGSPLSVSAAHATCTTTNTIQSTVNSLPNTHTGNVSISAKTTTTADVGANTHSSAVATLPTTPTTAASDSASPSVSSPTSTSAPTTPSHKTSRLSVLVPSTISPSIVVQSAFNMAHDGLTRSKDATTAFLYRTFSPTYRTTRLYIDSWSNGTQRRGLERIKKSVVRGDAFSLIKGSTTHMKGVWNQVMTAYRAKPSSTTTSTATRLASSKREARKDENGGNNEKSERSTNTHHPNSGNNSSSSSGINNGGSSGGDSNTSNRTRP